MRGIHERTGFPLLAAKELERGGRPGVESGKRHISGKENTEHET